MLIKRILLIMLLILASTTIFFLSYRAVMAQKTVSSGTDKLFELKGAKFLALTDILIAQEKGYFAEAGIKYKDVGVLKPQDYLPALVRGDIDFAPMHPDKLALARIAGARIIAVGPGIIDHPKYPHLIYFVKKGSPIKTAKDVKGKIIGIPSSGSCPDGIFLDWLQQNGIAKNEVKFSIIPEIQLEQVLKQGLVDVIASHPQSYQAIINHGGVTKLVDSYEIVKNPNGGTSFAVVVTEKWLKKHPDIATSVVGATIKAHDFINDHRADATKIAAAYLKIAEKDVSTFYFDDQKLITDERIQPWFDRLCKLGDLKPGQIKPSEIYTNSYNPYYKRKQ